jgi:hypothetical protein
MIFESLFYDTYDNMFIDQEGNPVIDIFRIMSPAKLMVCKQKRGTYYFNSPYDDNVMYEVLFPTEAQEEDGYYYSHVERTY